MDLQVTSIKLNIQTFLFKSRCKHCRSLPTTMFFYLDKHATHDHYMPNRKIVGANYVARYHLSYGITTRSFVLNSVFDGVSFSVRKARLPGVKYQQGMDLVSILECQCGKTSWAFTQSHRDHIKQRKCAIKVPRDIGFY